MKALAEGLALFFNSETAVSGFIKNGAALSSFISAMRSRLFERVGRIPPQLPVDGIGVNSFFYRYLTVPEAVYLSPERAAQLENTAARTALYRQSDVGATLSAMSESLVRRAASDSIATDLPLREAAAALNGVETIFNRGSDAEAQYAKTSETEKTVFGEPVKIQTGSSELSRYQINRIGDALGEQLHQRLAAGFPMYL